MPDPNLRAADADREAVAGVLGRALSEGRLTVEEYEDRLARAYAARTYGDLAGLTTDLPPVALPPKAAAGPASGPAPRPEPPRSPACGVRGRSARSVWASWLSTALIVTTIWLASSIGSQSLQPFWPIWVIGPWGAVLLARTITGQPHHFRGHRW